jgi:hypothetical protein
MWHSSWEFCFSAEKLGTCGQTCSIALVTSITDLFEPRAALPSLTPVATVLYLPASSSALQLSPWTLLTLFDISDGQDTSPGCHLPEPQESAWLVRSTIFDLAGAHEWSGAALWKRHFWMMALQLNFWNGARLRLIAVNGVLFVVRKGRARQKKHRFPPDRTSGLSSDTALHPREKRICFRNSTWATKNSCFYCDVTLWTMQNAVMVISYLTWLDFDLAWLGNWKKQKRERKNT